MKKKMSPVVHFELPAQDKKRITNFYSTIFGWETNQLGPDMNDYVVVMTTEVDEKTSRPKTPGAINGGFYLRDPKRSDQHPTVVIAVDDIQATMKQITEKGGQILSGPDEIPGVGSYVAFQDTEGNRIAVLQPSASM